MHDIGSELIGTKVEQHEPHVEGIWRACISMGETISKTVANMSTDWFVTEVLGLGFPSSGCTLKSPTETQMKLNSTCNVRSLAYDAA
jgi:hypothetical protein